MREDAEKSAGATPRAWLAAVLREPFLHFLALAGLIFLVYGAFGRGGGDGRRIDLTTADVTRLRAQFVRTWGREPTSADLAEAERGFVHEEVLYREALAKGMDRDDVIVRRRLAQKMEFLSIAGVGEPSDGEVLAYYRTHAAAYATPGSVSFQQIYFNADRRGAGVQADVARAMAQIETGASVSGDPLLAPASTRNQDVEAIARDWGPEFAQALTTAPVGRWIGPLRSAYGLHLVRVEARASAQAEPLDVVRGRVRSDLADQRLTAARQSAFQALLRGYSVTLEGRPFDTGAGR